ncbi:cation/H(+) antiporter 15-like [Impatiens glandulifera]|uniref:cation/H(+) antiporter 15-like n=1 Tax=Impatiens glandulifera TaxID=253017 RepID=UPI001FB05E38|nr:cation/H(+) antiporter 15-like [Impatiens glandulifera]
MTESLGPNNDTLINVGRNTILCMDLDTITGGFGVHNPLDFTASLLLVQLSLISAISILIDLVLQPLGQSSIVAQIVGGIIVGPTFLGHDKDLALALFPPRNTMVLDTIAAFGLMFFFFSIGVKMDISMLARPGKVAVMIGTFLMFFTTLLSVMISYAMKTYIPMDKSLARAIQFYAGSQWLTALPSLACLLTELKIVNADLSRLALSITIFNDTVGVLFIIGGVAFIESASIIQAALITFSSVVIIFIIVLFFYPVVKWIQRRVINDDKGVQEWHIIVLFICVPLTALMTEMVGQHYILGPFVLGLMVPEGPPLASAIETKLDLFISKLLYPVYLTVSGLSTNAYTISGKSAWILGLLTLFSCIIKTISVMLPACYIGIPVQEAFVLGLMLNARGVSELIVYNFWSDFKILTEGDFSFAVFAVIAVTAIITPLIRHLYDPSKNQIPLKRRNIQQSKPGTELKILACIFDEVNVHTMVNLLEASNATRENPIAVTTLLLVELVGRSMPMLIAHEPNQPARHDSSAAIINAFHQYELYNQGCTSLRAFSAISQLDMIHEDICRVGVDQNSSIIILPFHKQWAIDGSIGSMNRAIQAMNVRVLDRAPCSVGILVDRGGLHGTLSILNNQSTYHVCVLYVGGADDSESLCYAARMANHESVVMTLVRFLHFGSDNARERKVDNELISEVRRAHAGRDAFSYREELVRDGVGLAACIRGLESSFDLIVVGRSHPDSPLMVGLEEWSECPELGVVGDILASADANSTSSVLVVQQQKILGGKLVHRAMKHLAGDRDSLLMQPMPTPVGEHNDHSWVSEQNEPTWAVAMDKSSDRKFN